MTVPEAFLRFTVIVASRGRPDHLRRTLRAIRQLDYPAFEIVVVADSESMAALPGTPQTGLRFAEFGEPNLSAARNLGVAMAAGEVCAFVDDDAVPEPMWLRHHAAGLARTGAAASVGYVRGPDGIRFQSRFESIDRDGETHTEEAHGEEPFVPELRHGRSVKLVGTNMAVRRDVLTKLGGFDPAFFYYLEDGDLSLRLSGEGLRTAVVPSAEVHHALAASPRRASTRAPRTLFDVGRSTAIFLRRHSDANRNEIFHRIRKREWQRVLGAMIRGYLEPRDVPRLAKTLEEGWREGMRAELSGWQVPASAGVRFDPFPAAISGHAAIACRRLQKGAGLARARQITASEKARASLFCFSLTGLPQRVRYTDEGVWLQTGGQFADAGVPRSRFGWCRFANRVDGEFRRVAKRRGLNEGVHVEKLASSGFSGWVFGE